MNEQTRELIAIGVSIGAHCQTCLDYHVGKARELGVKEGDIREAIEVGYMVEKGASNVMRKHAGNIMNQSGTLDAPCCSEGGSTCCG